MLAPKRRRKPGNGRSKGGLSTKIHALVDALGNPLAFLLTPGQAHDLQGADALLPQMQADTLLADKLDADERVIEPLFGRIDILHNNVGINRKGGAASLTEADWDLVIDTNLKGMFLTCRAVLPIMERQRKGAIVNVSSITAIRYARRPYIAYATSKGGILAFTRTLAVEYAAKGIRANSILPGHINTPMVHVDNPGHPGGVEGFIKERDKWVPMGRMGEAWDVANAALFLASDEAAYITGAELIVDGGLTAATAW